jgi:hypothetical protein
MKRKMSLCTLLILLAITLIVAGCGRGPEPAGVLNGDGVLAGEPGENTVLIESSGRLVTRRYDYTDFDHLAVEFFDVDIRQGESYAVVIEVEENALPYIQVMQEAGRLHLGLDPEHTYNMTDVPLRAAVTMPALAALDLSMSEASTITGFHSEDDLVLILDLSSGLAGDLVANDLVCDLSLGSTLALSGSGRVVTILAALGSTVDLTDFAVEDARVTADNSSEVTVATGG